jgi:hypothetical protein
MTKSNESLRAVVTLFLRTTSRVVSKRVDGIDREFIHVSKPCVENSGDIELGELDQVSYE